MKTIMDLLENPGLLQLGYGLVHFLWQGVAIAVVLAVILSRLPRSRPGARYLASWIALLAMAACVPATVWLGDAPLENAAAIVPLKGISMSLDPSAQTDDDTTPFGSISPPLDPHGQIQIEGVQSAEPDDPTLTASWWAARPDSKRGFFPLRLGRWEYRVLPWIVGGWLLGALGLSLWRFGGWLCLRRFYRRGTRAASAASERMLRKTAARLRVSRPVVLLESTVARVPAVVGWVRPVILLPVGAITGLPPQCLEMVLAHELAHVRRLDFLWNLVQTAIETLLFYHPAVWWVSRKIRDEREACCDDVAATAMGDRVLYARTLAQLKQACQPAGPLAGSSLQVAAADGSLLVRIRRVLGLPSEDGRAWQGGLAGSLAVFGMIAALLAYAAVAREPQLRETDSARVESANASPADSESAEPNVGTPGVGLWSEPVKQLQGRLIVAKPIIGLSEQFLVDLQLRNVSTAPITVIHGNPFDFEAQIRDARGSPIEPTSMRIDVMHATRTSVIQPQAELSIPVSIRSLDGAKGSHLDTTTRIWTLAAAKYRLSGTYKLSAGRLTLPPVQLEIRDEENAGEVDTVVQVHLRSIRGVWRHNEAPILTADARNQATDPNARYAVFRRPVEHELEVDGQWYNYVGPMGKTAGGSPVLPGKEVRDAVEFWLSPNWSRRVKDRSEDPSLRLSPGPHTVRVALNAWPPAGEHEGRIEPVRFVSNPVRIEVLAPGPDDAGEATGPWSEAVDGLKGRLVMAHPRIGAAGWLDVRLQLRAANDTMRGVWTHNPFQFEMRVVDTDGNAVPPSEWRKSVPWGATWKRVSSDEGPDIPLTVPSPDGPGQAQLDAWTHVWKLAPGRYRISGTYSPAPPEKAGVSMPYGGPGTRWTGRLALPPVEIEVVDDGVALGGKAPAVQCRLQTAKRIWPVGDPLKFEALIWNNGTKEWKRPTDPLLRYEVDFDGRSYRWVGQVAEGPEGFPRVAIDRQSETLPIQVDWAWQDDGGQWLKCLPGKHTVRVAIWVFPADAPAHTPRAADVPFRVVSRAIEIEIVTEPDPAPQAPWGPPAEGVQVRLRADRPAWEFSETPTLVADVRNQGARELHLFRHESLCELEFDGRWYDWAGRAGSLKSSWFPPGREYYDIPATLTGNWQSKTDKKPLSLEIGKHTVRLAFVVRSPSAKDPTALPPVRCVSNPVETVIEEQNTSQSTTHRRAPPKQVVRIPVLANQEESPVIAVWREDWNLRSATDRGPFVITAVWPDGQIVWSRDDLNGGPPYFQGRIDRQTLRTTLADLETTGAFTASYVRTNNFGPDSYCTGVFLTSGTNTFMSRSWHELAEQNPNCVAASYGLTSLKGRTREDFLKSDDPAYQSYRRLWGEIRSKVRTLVPQNAEELGNVEFQLATRHVPTADAGEARANVRQ